jgi:hypothetical protein
VSAEAGYKTRARPVAPSVWFQVDATGVDVAPGVGASLKRLDEGECREVPPNRRIKKKIGPIRPSHKYIHDSPTLVLQSYCSTD